MQGYGGRMLVGDCTPGATRIVALAENTARALLGGNGLAARVLLDHVPAGIDAFDPANLVVFAVGPITDTTVPGNSRACVAAKSPLSILSFDSTLGGRFPATLKRTVFDAVVIRGRAAAPGYLVVTEQGAELKAADDLRGRTTRDTVQALVAAEGADADAIAIGPAGERRVRFAAMAHYWKNREGVSGRGGIGAVLGAKNLKAVVVKGARKTEIADAAALKALVDETREPLKTGTKALILANDLCDLLGMDTISLGVTLAFVAEALERGWLDKSEVGVPFGWGDWRGMLRLVEMTARREGFGTRLAEGAWRLAASVHPEGTKLVYAVKGLELPAHSARALKGPSIGYATATRGGSHHDTRPTPQYAQGFDRRSTKDKPAFAVRSQHFTALGDSLVMCRFTSERGFGLFVGDPYATMVRAVTGWDVTVDELERVGERIINLERLFNVREGVRRAQDVLPWKVMHEPIPDGPSAGMHCPPAELAAMLDDYYALRGWDADGVPTAGRLAALGLRS